MNSDFKNKIAYFEELYYGNARFIDMTRPHQKNFPHIWSKEEYNILINASKQICFARKFDEKVDIDIVKMIYINIK